MRILIHDFAGHPFQVQLSRELAKRGHQVLHAYFADIPGPKGNLSGNGVDSLRIEPIHLHRKFNAYSYWQRMLVHRNYAARINALISGFQPDVVLSGNTPTDAQYRIFRHCRRRGVRFLHWVQDFYALALEALLTRKLGRPGQLVAYPFHLLERRLFAGSDAVIYISEDFAAYAAGSHYKPKRAIVVENWATLSELPQRKKDNPWALKHGLDSQFVFLYSGTMGLKHSPATLIELAKHFSPHKDVKIVLISQGIGREVLAEAKEKQSLDNLLLFDFQEFSDLPDVLASADVLLASVERDAGTFCVPSKILSYLCAGRAVLLSVSPDNLAARIVQKANAGYTCEPGDHSEFVQQALFLNSNREVCACMGRNARQYAETTFNIDQISCIFEAIMRGEESAAELRPAGVGMPSPTPRKAS